MKMKLETSIEIQAEPRKVWAVLSDFSAYPEWNPFVREARGELREGERIVVRMSPPGGKPMQFKPRLLRVEAGSELRWLGHLLVPGLFDGEHFFRLEKTEAGTRLIHGERFSGILVRPLKKTLDEDIKRGFEEMNAALKRVAESA